MSDFARFWFLIALLLAVFAIGFGATLIAVGLLEHLRWV